MALSLKRKRYEITTSRKVRKSGDQKLSEGSDQDANDSMNDSTSLHGDSDFDEVEGGEWTGTGLNVPPPSQKGADSFIEPPTGEELRVIKVAADLFKSTSFKLQIDVLLPIVRPKPSRIPPLERFLLSLHTFIMEISPLQQQHPLEAARKMLTKGIAVPYILPLPTEETNWKVGYESPNDVFLVGSWPNKMSVKPKDGLRYGVDLAVEMPDSLFQEKDYLNGRFFQKRAFYLAVIASAIESSKTKLNVETCYESPSGDPRLTNLVLIPRKDGSPTDFTKLNAKVIIIPTVSKTCPIPLNRLSPLHSNLRFSSNQESTQNQLQHPSSLIYNNALLRAFMPRLHLLSTHNLKNEAQAFSDAVTLLRVWANQRGFADCGEANLRVHGFEGRGTWWNAVVSLVLVGEEPTGSGNGSVGKRKALGRGLSSYQMFKAALNFLANFEFGKEAVFVKSAGSHRFSPVEYDVQQQPVFVDSTSVTNLLSGVLSGGLELLRYEALATLETLDTSDSEDSFAEVFLKDQRSLPTRFDSILRVDLSDVKPRHLPVDATYDRGSVFDALLASIDQILHRGLNDRTKSVTILSGPIPRRPLSQASPNYPDVIYIGLIHHAHHAMRLVDHGPVAGEEDQTKIAAFRELWGGKSELRRFKDGRIVESVVWDVKTVDERAHIPTLITKFLLQHHFGLTSSSSSDSAGAVQGWHSAFDSILRLPENVSNVYLNGGLPVGYKSALSAFDGLVKSMKQLDDELPLVILNVSPICEALRYTSVFAPVPLPESVAHILPPNARYLPYMDLVVEFERSFKWPDDLKAIQKIKLAIFKKMAETLMKALQGSKARVVKGDGVHEHNPVLDQSFLEVVTPEGWAFALHIWNIREEVLLDRVIAGRDNTLPHIGHLKNQKQLQGREYHDAMYAKEVYTQRFIHAPRHHRAIAAFCHRYSAYAGTVRLVKRWLAAHWVLGPGRVSEEVVELICTKVFLGADGRYLSMDVDSDEAIRQPSVPGTKERGFSRVIEFFKDWKWEEGTNVHLYAAARKQSNGSSEDTAEAVEGGAAKRINREAKKDVKGSNAVAWTITTDFDQEGKMWTSNGPDVVVARRVKVLALAAWDFLQDVEKGCIDVQTLFTHPVDDYDFIVQLEPSLLPRYLHSVTGSPDKLTKRGQHTNGLLNDPNEIIRPGFDPARMLFDDLQRVYADTFKIFYDPFGGDRFGAIWDPSVKQPKPFRVLGGFSSTPVNKENQQGKGQDSVFLNQTAILDEVKRMGTSQVNKIIMQ